MHIRRAAEWLPSPKSLSATLTRPLSLTLAACAALFCPPAMRAQATTLSGYEDAAQQQQNVFYRGSDQHIYLRSYNPQSGTRAQDLTSLAGASAAAANSSVTSFKDLATAQQHVVFEDGNGHLYDLSSGANYASWSVQDMTAATGSALAAAGTPLTSYFNNDFSARYVFYIGTNQHLNLLYWWGGGWVTEDITAVAGAPVAAANSALTSMRDEQGNLDHVYYEGADQHIHEIYSGTDPGNLYIMDDTAAAGGTSAVAASPLSAFFDAANRQENVFYIGVDLHVHHLSFQTFWQWEDLTAKTAAPASLLTSPLSAFLDTQTGQQHVFYLGTDQSLQQLYYTTRWYPEDVTLDAAAPLPAVSTALTSFKDDPDNQQHAYFTGANQHFYHLYFAGKWSVEDLSSGAALPAH